MTTILSIFLNKYRLYLTNILKNFPLITLMVKLYSFINTLKNADITRNLEFSEKRNTKWTRNQAHLRLATSFLVAIWKLHSLKDFPATLLLKTNYS